MEYSSIPMRKWSIVIYLDTKSLNGISSLRLQRDVKITQKCAWLIVNWLREAFDGVQGLLHALGEADETDIGGIHRNHLNARRRKLRDAGWGMVRKTAFTEVKGQVANKKVRKWLSALIHRH